MKIIGKIVRDFLRLYLQFLIFFYYAFGVHAIGVINVLCKTIDFIGGIVLITLVIIGASLLAVLRRMPCLRFSLVYFLLYFFGTSAIVKR